MKLYGTPVSPFVQRALIVARAKGHELPVEPPPGGTVASPEFAAISPMRRMPVLACDDGWTLAESGAIAAYLDEVLDGPPLLPAGPRERAQVRLIEQLATCELAGLRPILTGRLFRREIAPEVVEAAVAQTVVGLAAIERVRDPDDWFAAGAMPTHADALLLPLLALCEVIDARADTDALVTACTGLAAYRARAADDAVLGRTIVEMRAGFPALLARIG